MDHDDVRDQPLSRRVLGGPRLQLVRRRLMCGRGNDRAGRCAIAIMAKAPDAGRVKTRLLPVLRAEEARELSACFLRDMTRMLALAGREVALDGCISFAPAGAEASFAP